jgi:hypothetical protein
LNTSFADAVLVYVRCEAIAAADAIGRGDAGAAMQSIAQAMRVVEMLAAEPHVVARLTAAIARRETFSVVQRLVNCRLVTRAHLVDLEHLVSRQLATWPNDAQAWMGDRALGLCSYEMIRDGQILSVLTDDELVEIRRGEGVEIFIAAVAKNVDHDETLYLREMGDVIRLCEQPHYERVPALEQLEIVRTKLSSSPDYPIVADRLLLQGISTAQRQQAADLALARAWSTALALACGASLPPPQANPLTGENYKVTVSNARVVIGNIDPLHPELAVIMPIAKSPMQAAREKIRSYR